MSVKSTLGAAPSVRMKPRWPPEPVSAQSCSLLRSRYQGRYWGGALRDVPNNGCEEDY